MLPIERPGKIVCVGLNYRDHAEEQGVELPSAPLLFAKWPNALIGPGEAIVIPKVVTKCDYEAELGVVIGTQVKNVSRAERIRSRARVRLRQRCERPRPPVRRRPVDAWKVP